MSADQYRFTERDLISLRPLVRGILRPFKYYINDRVRKSIKTEDIRGEYISGEQLFKQYITDTYVDGDERLCLDERQRNIMAEAAAAFKSSSAYRDRLQAYNAANSVRAEFISSAVLLNNKKDASGMGHVAVLLLNLAGQGFYYSFALSPDFRQSRDDIFKGASGEVSTKVMPPSEVSQLLRNKELRRPIVWRKEGVVMLKERQTYERFVRINISPQQGRRMWEEAERLISNVPSYILLYRDCLVVCREILSYGCVMAHALKPNNFYNRIKRFGASSWDLDKGAQAEMQFQL